jgi:cyanophycin synthetase
MHLLRWKVFTLIVKYAALIISRKVRNLTQRGRGGKATNDHGTNNEIVIAASERLGIQVRKLSGGFLELRKGDQTSYSSGSDFMFENVISWKIAGDKVVTATLLNEHELPVPKFAVFSPFAYPAALQSFKEFPKPVVVKPRLSTSGGTGVTTGISSEKDFHRAFAVAGSYGKDVMIEEFVPGDNYRVLVLSGRILSIIKRNRLHVIGDGKSTVAQLLDHSLAYNIGRPRPTMQRILDNDTRQYLKNNNLSMKDVPGPSERFYLKTVCNSGPIEEVTDSAAENCKILSLKAEEVLGIRLCAVDLFSEDYSGPASKGQFVINEVNTSPVLFATGTPVGLGKPELRCTEEILKEIFAPM